MPPPSLVSVITIPPIALLIVFTQKPDFSIKKGRQRGGTVEDFGSEDLVYESPKTLHKNREQLREQKQRAMDNINNKTRR